MCDSIFGHDPLLKTCTVCETSNEGYPDEYDEYVCDDCWGKRNGVSPAERPTIPDLEGILAITMEMKGANDAEKCEE